MAWIEERKTAKGEARYLVGWWEPGGSKRTKTVTKKKDAQALAQEVERAKRLGEYLPAAIRKTTVGEYLERTLLAREDLRPSTRYQYERLVERWIRPYLASSLLAQVTSDDLRGYMIELRDEGASSSVRARVRKVLNKVFRQAHREGIIARNPVATVPAPVARERPIRPLDPREIDRLAQAAPERWRAMVYLAAYGGLRAGELMALRVEDVNILRRQVRVMGSMYLVSGRAHFGPTKTDSGRRLVTIPRFVAAELQRHMEEFPPTPDRRIFYTQGGGALTSFHRMWVATCRRAGVEPRPRFHDLRHTAAALAIRAGAHPKAIQARMGHASIKVTMDVYGHLFPAMDEELADDLEQMARGAAMEVR